MTPTTLRQQAYQHLRDRLLAGELAAGTQLSEPDLARQLGMSRTPVREALRQMENEGLLEYAPRFGAMVRVPERAELGEMYEVRAALESHAAAAAARRIRSGELDDLATAIATMRKTARPVLEGHQTVLRGTGLRDFVRADLEFHTIFITAAGNRYLSKILEENRLLVRVFTATLWQYDATKLEQAIDFHQRLLDAIRHQDEEAARKATLEAMQVARQNALHAWDHQHQPT